MKNMLIAFYASIIALVVILIGFTIHSRSIRQVELDNALKSSMEEAMYILLQEEGRPKTEEEWKALFIQSLLIQIDSKSDLAVNILEADMEKGLLSVEATMTWTHFVGTQGHVSSSLVVLMEDYEKPKEEAFYVTEEAEKLPDKREETSQLAIKVENSENPKSSVENNRADVNKKPVNKKPVNNLDTSTWKPSSNENVVSPYQQRLIDAGYGIVVYFAETDSYGVLMKNEQDTIDGKDGFQLLLDFLSARDLTSSNITGGWIDVENEWYMYVAYDTCELITSDEEEFWD